MKFQLYIHVFQQKNAFVGKQENKHASKKKCHSLDYDTFAWFLTTKKHNHWSILERLIMPNHTKRLTNMMIITYLIDNDYHLWRRTMKYVCNLCGYVYDEAAGDPDNGIAPGTKWEDVPEDWVCPLCGAGKEEFSQE